MKITEMTNVFTAHNKAENFTLCVLAECEADALKIAQAYAHDTDMSDDFTISETVENVDYDCDYIVTAHDYGLYEKSKWSL